MERTTIDPMATNGNLSAPVVSMPTPPSSHLAMNGMELALGNLERIQRTLVRTVVLSREDRLIEASKLLKHCLEGLDRVLEALAYTQRTLNADLGFLQTELLQLKESIGLSFAGGGSVADQLEDELLPQLGRWAQKLRKTHSQLNETHFT